MTSTDPTRRFDERASDYDLGRIGYPPTIADALREACSLAVGSVIAELGCGTGKLSRRIVGRGWKVIGVDPSQPMLDLAKENLASYPDFETRLGRAEATGCDAASVDLVVAAQSFHWFDLEQTRAELQRILRPPRRVALIWNDRHTRGSPFSLALEALLLEHALDIESVGHRGTARDERVAALFGDRPYRKLTLPHTERFDVTRFHAYLASVSYLPMVGTPGYEDLRRDAMGVFEAHAHDGSVSIDVSTTLFVGRLDR